MDGDVSSAIGGNDGYVQFLTHLDTLPFVDDSRQLRTITNNNVTLDTSIKKFGGGSAAFDGTAYLSLADSNGWTPGSSDFTIDFWVRSDFDLDGNSYSEIMGHSTDGNNFWRIIIFNLDHGSTPGQVKFDTYWSGTSQMNLTSSNNAVSANTWHHIAIVVDGTDIKLYVDGTLEDTNTYVSIPNFTGNLVIGANPYNPPQVGKLEGNLDEIRISKLIARWTSEFTPPTEAYGGHNLLSSGDPKLQTSVKKFGSASLDLDGSGEYIYSGNHNDWNLFSDNFTIDCWVRFTSLAANRAIVGSRYDGNNVWGLVWQTNNTLMLFGALGGTNRFNWQCPWTPSVDTWYHVAVVRDGSTCKMFIDGDSKTVTDYESGWGTWTATNADLDIGLYGDGTGKMQGYIDEFRISKDIARWTENFTPPTEEYETDEYTKLLLHFPGDMSDSAHNVFFNGSVQMSVSPTKYNGSFYFDGTSYLRISDNSDFSFGSGDFTIDLWVNFSSFPSNGQAFIMSDDDSAGWEFYWSHTTGPRFWDRVGGGIIAQGSTTGWSLNTWYHLALVRNGNNWNIYKDGVSIASETNSLTISDSTDPVYIGSWKNSLEYFEGFMDEIRVSNTARWTENFTPPAEPYEPSYISGDMSDGGRIIALRETDWTIVHNDEHTGGSYIVSGLGADDVTVIFRKSDGECQAYGNVTPQ